MQTRSVLQATAEIQWPCPLPDATKASLLQIARPFDPSRLMGPMPGIFYVLSGCVVGYATNEAMDNSLGLIFGHGSWFGIQYIDNPEYAPVELFETLLPTRLLLFPKDSLQFLLEKEPLVYKLLFFISQQIGRMTLQIGSNTLFCLTTRVTYLLLELARQHALVEDSHPVLKITQQRLSQIAGISRPRVNEVLNVLADAGEIAIRRGEILLLDFTAMKARLPQFSFMYHDPVPHIDHTG
ncbi:Crp/Fnr family transcriptional regulator [Pseudaeromonas sharmana]|uniref:Crp/Fnr family transcriptional regulator n=1 Tax=Pseudaeromonas sharmana TaxID=328412 RepID=A0ABV8CP75_9GAMM